MSSNENKVKWSVTVDAELAKRIDEVAAKREENRSETVERILRGAIEGEESFVTALEDPVQRFFIEQMTRPGMAAMLARFAGESMTPEQMEELQRNRAKQLALAKQRVATKRGRGKSKEATA